MVNAKKLKQGSGFTEDTGTLVCKIHVLLDFKLLGCEKFAIYF